jgi:bacterioferritin-associated ferredoxin
MYICICKKVTDHQIRQAVYQSHVKSVGELRSCLGACDQCGKCVRDAREIIQDAALEKFQTESNRALVF